MIASVTDDLLQKRESERLEFRSATAGLESFGATVCAFLNSSGGTLIVGVGARGEVERIPNASKLAEEVEKYLQSRLSPRSLWSISIDGTPQGDVVTIEVPPGTDRPYVCNGATFIRKGAATVAADADAIRDLVRRQHQEPTRWERLPAPGLEMSDLDEEEIVRTVRHAQQQRNHDFRNVHDLADVLTELGMMASGRLTNGADVLFSRNPSFRLPQTRIRATVYTSDKGGDFADNRVFEGNAFAVLEQVSAFVNQHVRIASEFKPGRVTRKDRPQYPFWALREGLTNAIIHRDYSAFAGGMSVSVYPGRIEIWNSGRLPNGLTVADLKKEVHPSLPVNPHMAHVFYLRELIERVGRGTFKIVQECKAAGLRTPQWKESPSGITLTFFGQGRRRAQLNARQKELLERMRPGEELRPAEYYETMKAVIGQRQAQRDLSGLASGGWLEQQGEGPATIYIRTDAKAP